MTIPSRKHVLTAGLFSACVLLAPGLSMAGGNVLRVADLAAATGLTKTEVQMVLGARTPFPEYFTSYERAQRRLEQALGTARYRELMAGREIVLDNGQRFALAKR